MLCEFGELRLWPELRLFISPLLSSHFGFQGWAANLADSLLGKWQGVAKGFSGQSYLQAKYTVVFDQVVGNAIRGLKVVTYSDGAVSKPSVVYVILGSSRQITGAEEDGYWNGRLATRNQISFVYSERDNVVSHLPAALDVTINRVRQ